MKHLEWSYWLSAEQPPCTNCGAPAPIQYALTRRGPILCGPVSQRIGLRHGTADVIGTPLCLTCWDNFQAIVERRGQTVERYPRLEVVPVTQAG